MVSLLHQNSPGEAHLPLKIMPRQSVIASAFWCWLPATCFADCRQSGADHERAPAEAEALAARGDCPSRKILTGPIEALEAGMKYWALLLSGFLVSFPISGFEASAQDYAGPLLPHVGAQITTAFANRYGPDAEAYFTFTAVTPELLSLNYSSTRGLNTRRNIRMADRQSSQTYVLGYAANMPLIVPNTTSLGISGTSLVELRNTGKTQLSLMYDAKLSLIDGQLTLIEKDIRVPLIIDDQVVQIPVVHASGTFTGAGNRSGTGDFYFLDNKNNPMMIQSTIQFSFEKNPRTERIVRVAAGASMRSAMEQSLSTLRKYDLYGIHFDFDKARMRPESATLIKDIALTLTHNPTWTLQINGHTDSIGDQAYNKRLSAARAKAVADALIKRGIAARRLLTAGLGSTQPKGDNSTLQGRALNRRVELVRTDR
jgi:outer membrane protein OmpA-like peptidoglycan-associated protein